jgi:hypothetical protein
MVGEIGCEVKKAKKSAGRLFAKHLLGVQIAENNLWQILARLPFGGKVALDPGNANH